jgi:hypothetical protein
VGYVLHLEQGQTVSKIGKKEVSDFP